MDQGNWLALDKRLMYFLPKDRPYTIIEAMFSYTLDQDKNNNVSIIGYSRMWKWSRCKVRRFLNDMTLRGTHIPENAPMSSDRGKTGLRQEIRIVLDNLHKPLDRGKTGLRQ